MKRKDILRIVSTRLQEFELANVLEGMARYREWQYEQKQETQAETKETETETRHTNV